MSTPSSPIAVVTGANSGIGRATAIHLAQNGYKVFGTVRKIEKANKAMAMANEGGISIEWVELDIADDQSVTNGFADIMQRTDQIDVLVNNAGFGIAGAVEYCSEEEIRAQFDANFFGALTMIREVVPQMRQAGGGLIINMASIGGLLGLPFQGIYSATKFALVGLSEALRVELRPFNIRVSVICPGDFATGFTRNRRICDASLGDSPYRNHFSGALRQMEQDEAGGADPLLVARLIEKIMGIRSPKVCYTVGKLEQTLFAEAKRILPSGLFNRIVDLHYR